MSSDFPFQQSFQKMNKFDKYLVKTQVHKSRELKSFTTHCYYLLKKNMGGFLKILRNFQSGSWQMLTSAYKVGGWGKKRPKTCLRNT